MRVGKDIIPLTISYWYTLAKVGLEGVDDDVDVLSKVAAAPFAGFQGGGI